MKQRKVLVGIAIAIFIILLLYWLLVAEDMKPWLSAMVPSVAQQFFAFNHFEVLVRQFLNTFVEDFRYISTTEFSVIAILVN